jgi:hypothetical protein
MGKPEENEPPTCKWDCNIKINLKEIGGVAGTELM